jgi:hypothetical protein
MTKSLVSNLKNVHRGGLESQLVRRRVIKSQPCGRLIADDAEAYRRSGSTVSAEG